MGFLYKENTNSQTNREETKNVSAQHENADKKERFFQRKFINISLTIFFGIALSILFFFLLYNSKHVNLGIGKFLSALRPFIYGFVIAYLLVPMCNFFDRNILNILSKLSLKPGKKGLKAISFTSIIMSLCSALLIIYILLSLLLPQFIISLTTIADNFDSYYETISNWINQYFKNNKFIYSYAESITETLSSTFHNWFQTELLPNSKTLLTNVSSGVIGAFSIIMNLLLGIIVSVYCLNSRKIFAAQAKIFTHAIFKQKIANKIISEVNFANKMFMGFISGRIVDSTIIGCLCFVGMQILHLPYPLLISVIIGVTNVIPFFGPFIGAIPSAFIILMVSPVKCIWFIIFIFILQQLDGNVIGPKVVGDKTNLSSFWVLFAILVFSKLLGVVGMLIGVPIFAVVYHIIQELVMLGLKRTKYVPTKEEAEISLLNDYLAQKHKEDNVYKDTTETSSVNTSQEERAQKETSPKQAQRVQSQKDLQRTVSQSSTKKHKH